MSAIVLEKNCMDNLIDRVNNQFDTLIPYLALSHEDVFELINKEKGIWFSPDQVKILPDSYKVFQQQIIHSAFLLGYSYFEAFLSDLVRHIYYTRPEILPKEKMLKYSEILNTTDYNAILELMIEREIIDLFYKKMKEVIKYFKDKLNLKWIDDLIEKTIVSSLIRNCIIHNLNKADNRLANYSSYNIGDEIQLSFSDVHSYGIDVRNVMSYLYNQADEIYFRKNEK